MSSETLENWSSEFGLEFDQRFDAHDTCPFTSRLGQLFRSAHVRRFAEVNNIDTVTSITEADEINIREMLARGLARIDSDAELPRMPTLIEKIDNVLDKPDVSFREVADVIVMDPALVARILQLVNSPIYGLKREIQSVQQAISYIGMTHVRNLALSVSVIGLFKQKHDATLDLSQFWQHSLTVAIGSRIIARVFVDRGESDVDPEEAFLAGLMHDIGRVLISVSFAKEHAQIVEYAQEHDVSTVDAELSILGFRHTDIGHRVLSAWNLSENICDAVLHHHEPKANSIYPVVVKAADTIAHGLGFYTYRDSLQPTDPSIWARLRLSDSVIESTAFRVLEQYDSIKDGVFGPAPVYGVSSMAG